MRVERIDIPARSGEGPTGEPGSPGSPGDGGYDSDDSCALVDDAALEARMQGEGSLHVLVRKALGLDSAAEKKITIIGLPDEAKGEVLILLTALEMDDTALGELRQKLLAAGVPALWIPKKTVPVEEIPALASGKLDIKRCEQLARTGSSA